MQARAAYRVGQDVFAVMVGTTATPPETYTRSVFTAACYRVAPGSRLERVLAPDGQPLEAHAPTAWQAIHRLVTALETYLGARGEEVRDFGDDGHHVEGTYVLPG